MKDQNRKTVARFMQCEEGQEFLKGIQTHLKGHTIDNVTFVNNGEGVTTILTLNNGQCYAFNDSELTLETLSEQFSGLIRELTLHGSQKKIQQTGEACNE